MLFPSQSFKAALGLAANAGQGEEFLQGNGCGATRVFSLFRRE